MAARFVRASVCSCVRLQATLAGSASCRGLSTSRALSVRGTKLSVERDDERCAVEDDFYGISGDHGVVTVDNPLGDRHERLRRFSHLTRCRDAKVSDETVVAADFGTIRYDRDNRARYHGQFEDDTLLDELVLDTYGGKESKPGRKAPDESANQSELQDTRETSVSARKKKRSGDSAEGATPASTDVQDLSNAAVKLSEEVARSLPPRSLPVDDRQLQLSKARPSASVIEKSSSESQRTCSNTDFLGAARSSEQNSTLGRNHLEGVVGKSSPAKATAEKSKRSTEHVEERHGKELSGSGASSPLTSSSESFVTSARTAEKEDCESSVPETRTRVSRQPRSNYTLESNDERNTARSFLKEPTTVTTQFDLGQSSSSAVGESSNASQNRTKTRIKKESDEAIADDSSGVPDEGNPTAFEYVRKPQQFSLKLDSKGFFILKSEVRPNLAFMLRSEVVDMLRQRVLYDGNDILILDKPYGMICHGSAKGVPDSHVLVRLLPDLSAALYPREDVKLYTVHRLDRDVTGAIVLAKTQRMADMLQTQFEQHNISKTYHAITFGVPDNDCATIDMPLAEGSVGLAKRMVICPKLEPEFERLVPKFSKTYEAITHYRVLCSHGRAAYLEVKPVTGVKHQIRVHLGFGLRCPILGDHKYSHLRELAPQRLSGDLLDRLNVRQTKVRHIPMHLHASAVLIPEILDGKNLLVTAQLPYHFLQNLKRLKLQRH
uniref:Pseudouridylate synthase RPUSD4, mitochondrial n=1 Tax=Rhipicephalus appendiculatus TaxID=34631 RepID=A0A131YH01_RHIAP